MPLVELKAQRSNEVGFNLTILSRSGSRIASRNLKSLAVVVESGKRAAIRNCDDFSRKLVRISRGRRTKTVIQLKRSWRTAAEKPRRYICMSLMLYKAMIVEVRLVPMLVPMMMGMPCLTERVLEATRVTTSTLSILGQKKRTAPVQYKFFIGSKKVTRVEL